MNAGIASLLCISLIYGGFAALSFAMDRHQTEVFGRALDRRTTLALRLGGSLILACSLLPCMWAWGVSIGIVGWLGMATGSAVTLVLLLRYARRPALCLAWFAPLAAITITLIITVNTAVAGTSLA
jgi:hypothetical protein